MAAVRLNDKREMQLLILQHFQGTGGARHCHRKIHITWIVYRLLVQERLQPAQGIAKTQTGTKATADSVHITAFPCMSARRAALLVSAAITGATSGTEALAMASPTDATEQRARCMKE